jgi:hypothetical protein
MKSNWEDKEEAIGIWIGVWLGIGLALLIVCLCSGCAAVDSLTNAHPECLRAHVDLFDNGWIHKRSDGTYYCSPVYPECLKGYHSK